MTDFISIAGLQIARPLYDLVKNEIAPGTPIGSDAAWQGFAELVADMTTRNRSLLSRRDELQARIDAWHLEHQQQAFDLAAYKAYLYEIGYLLQDLGDFTISTDHIDDEIALIAGPQLVVPVNNARYAINAANARWGSLFDALYGTDVIPEDNGAHKGDKFNPVRGAKVIAYGKAFLDDAVPLKDGSYIDAIAYAIKDGQLAVTLSSGVHTGLTDPAQFKGYQNNKAGKISSLLLLNNNLHIEIHFNTDHPIHELHPTGIRDIYLESAISTIMDCEDSVAAVDAEDKVIVYRNWLGLMKGDLSCSFNKNGSTIQRQLKPNRAYKAADGTPLELPARSLMLNRNVGHHMTTNAVLDLKGNEIFEGMLDAFITTYSALHDLQPGQQQNSRKGSIYIVKPKMHGPEEVAFTVELFSRIEDIFKLPRNTLKIGIMDEERRTTLNLRECIRAASQRIIFINTGFLDRTGDEIHTSMEAGPMVRKNDMKSSAWLQAYENWNVDIGLSCGLAGKAQIGKGMWTMPDLMSAMMKVKRAHPEAGANTAWVPSPTAATLHAIHYHQANVTEIQKTIKQREHARLDDLLLLPLADSPAWSTKEIQEELDNNLQGILGYVVRWVDQGIGASKVPDIHNVELMEDRATLRISSQHVANWLHHGIISESQVMTSLKQMAELVDQQNIGTPSYIPMAPHYIGLAFQAAQDMIFHGRRAPNGYTEPTLHRRRRQIKAALRGE